MESQLTLIDIDEDLWTLDEHTRQTGRRGVANAREALRLAAVFLAGQEPSRASRSAGPQAGERQAA